MKLKIKDGDEFWITYTALTDYYDAVKENWPEPERSIRLQTIRSLQDRLNKAREGS